MTSASGALSHERHMGVHSITLSGVLTMDSVGAMYQQLKPFEAGATLVMDASAVTRADSSALALVTTLMRRAREQNMRVEMKPLPHALSAIIQIYGLQDILTACDA
jgi:ABC-type transporter Mla MlaB component